MGGDIASSLVSSSEEESVEGKEEFPEISLGSLACLIRKDGSRAKAEDGGAVEGEKGAAFEEYGEVRRRISSKSLDLEADRRRISDVYGEVLESYNVLLRRSGNLEAPKARILSYVPGAWIEEVGGMTRNDYEVPKTTLLLLVGPKGSGKSSLVNRISKVFEDDKFTSERAQVSYNSSVGDGTAFLHEYMIPRGSISFSLCDTRSLSDDSSENIEMLRQWMTRGVRHGEPVIRGSDSWRLKTRMKQKARQNGYNSSEIKMVNFVIFVVNGLSVLKSMNSDDEADKQYTEMVATAFNCPYLSFKDDKPVIIVTHGDLLSLSDRARVRVHLGELLGVPPAKQIFDIPERCDRTTELAIVDMLSYSLEHADKNLPCKEGLSNKVFRVALPTCLFLLIALGIAIIAAQICGNHNHRVHRQPILELNTHIDWHKMRHLWLDLD
ncbi:uncharacterized protein LOC127797970 [Diospyros lotus]|uniref:uncharacterized protein LOC127797970 n=1 Tax=Diospyros lotus TaxID=55363 RepID=UPI00225A1979|nr:uncharacterized protein LOC127797970 [Diospyros lotus]